MLPRGRRLCAKTGDSPAEDNLKVWKCLGVGGSTAGDEKKRRVWEGEAWSRGHTRLQWPVGHVGDRPVPG